MVSCPLLTPPNPPLRRDALRLRGEMRGAHRGVWCSKIQHLMEAELFAAESCRSALSGRALLCAANHASKIHDSSAAYKLKDARNRAPVTPPFRRATEGSRVLRKGRGVKRGRKTLVSLPLLSPPGDHGIPPPPDGGYCPRPLRA